MRSGALLCRMALALLTAAAIPAFAADTTWVEVTAEVYGLHRTPRQARREALQRARDKAVAEVAGIHIAAQQMRLKSDHGDTVRDAFSYLIHTSAHGRIVTEEIAYDTRLVEDIPVYRATLRAEVALEQGSRDPGFDLEIATRPSSHTFRAGEAIAIRITPSRRSYVTVLNLGADGTLSVLFPNSHAESLPVEAGQTLLLPRPSDPFRIEATAPPGNARGPEQILVVATLDPVDFRPPSPSDKELVPGEEATSVLTALNRWLVRIPANRRVEALWEYEVIE